MKGYGSNSLFVKIITLEPNQIKIEKGILNLHWQDLPEKYKNALIIEWFDSVGIYVNAELDYLHIVWFPTINNDWNFEEREFETRQEAIKEAIKKANEIYNSK